MEFKLNKTQRLVANGAEDKTGRRPILQCVHITKGQIETVDGFVLAQRRIDYDGDEELLLEAAQIAKHKDSKTMPGVVYTTVEDSKEVRAVGEDIYTCQIQSGDFPKTEKLYPEGTPVFQIALGRSVLLKLLKCLGKDEEVIKFSFYSKESPVKFVYGDNEVKGVIMPCNVRENATW